MHLTVNTGASRPQALGRLRQERKQIALRKPVERQALCEQGLLLERPLLLPGTQAGERSFVDGVRARGDGGRYDRPRTEALRQRERSIPLRGVPQLVSSCRRGCVHRCACVSGEHSQTKGAAGPLAQQPLRLHLGFRCPECANEMEGPEAVVCLKCGYNTLTRQRIETRKTVDRAKGLLMTGSSDFHGPEHSFGGFRAFEFHGLEPNLGPIGQG